MSIFHSAWDQGIVLDKTLPRFDLNYNEQNIIHFEKYFCFMKIEGVIMIAKLVQRFDFKLDPNQSFDCAVETTMRPKDGTKCYLSVRSDKD